MSQPDSRWIQRFDNFKRAFARLSEGSELAEQCDLSDLERQGLIQAFEVTHELAWNTLKQALLARIDEALDDLLQPNQMDLSLFARLTHPNLLDHIRRGGMIFYERSPATPEAHPA